METSTHRTAPAALAGLLTLTALVLAAPAHASRIPSDPLTFVPTPVQMSRLVTDAHASSVQDALASLWSDIAGK